MDKVAARQIGVTKALMDSGYSPDAIKLAFVQRGVQEETADFLVKEALGPISLLTRAIRPAIGWLGKAFGAGLKGSRAPHAGTALKGLMGGGAGSQWLGRNVHRAAGGAREGLLALGMNPGQALGRGALEAGKGALMFGGKGIGGTLGKGVGGYHMGRMILGE